MLSAGSEEQHDIASVLRRGNEKQKGHSGCALAVADVIDRLVFGGGVEGVAEAVADDVETKHCDEDEQAGGDDQIGALGEEGLGVGEHVAPARNGRFDAKTEEAERCFDQNQVADVNRQRDDDNRKQVGQDMRRT